MAKTTALHAVDSEFDSQRAHMAGERPPLVILAGQPVLNLELLPDEGCVLLELGATPQMGRVTAKFFLNSSLVEVVSEAAVAQAAGFHLLYFRVALDEKLEVTSYEAGAVVPPDTQVTLRKTSSGEIEVSGRVFRGGEMDLAVGLSKDGKLVKTAILTKDDYADVDLRDTAGVKREALGWAEKIGNIAEDEMRPLNFAAFAETVRREPEIAALLALLAAGGVVPDVM